MINMTTKKILKVDIGETKWVTRYVTQMMIVSVLLQKNTS